MNVTTVKSMEDANVYHYHRPNLEPFLRFPAMVSVHHDINDSDRRFQFPDF